MSNPRKPETVSVRVRETTYEIVKELSEKHGCKAVQVWDMMLADLQKLQLKSSWTKTFAQ